MISRLAAPTVIIMKECSTVVLLYCIAVSAVVTLCLPLDMLGTTYSNYMELVWL